MEIKIGNKTIGSNYPCFIIAEAGVNHNGNINLAKKLIDAAVEAGADAVKFQTFKTENLVSKSSVMAKYQQENIGKKETPLKMLKKLEICYDDFVKLKNYCDEKEIIFLSTPHTEDAIDFLERLVPAYKIGSGDLNNFSFLEKIAEKKKQIILSTGMSTLKEVKEAVRAIKNKKNNKIILLHCTANYPCPLEEVNLKAMKTLQDNFPEIPCGYSDHTTGIFVPIMAVSLGARLIEKHFTLDKNMPGPDHKASLEPAELKDMVKKIRMAENVLGNGIKKPNRSEEEISKVAKKSIVANKEIKKGSAIKREHLIIKRPGTGIEPKNLNKIIGRVAKRNIKKDSLIKLIDLKNK
jgi:N,N'-diacetyllegionaminate synthase